MPNLPAAGDTSWRDDWGQAVHDAAEAVTDGRLSEAGLAADVADDASTLGGALRAALGTVFKAEWYGTVDTTGVADSSAAVEAAIQAAYDAGGGTVLLPEGTIKVSPQIVIPNDGATPPKQPPIELCGRGSHWSGRGTAPVGGTLLDLAAAVTTGKIETTGLGLLSLRDLTLRDSSGDDSPFIHTTNTTVHTDNVSFVGSKQFTACDQDAIVLGGTQAVHGQGDPDHGFQGYGTVISRCFFSGIRRAVVGRVYANALVIRDNTVWATCGNTTGGAIELDGDPAGGAVGSQNSGALITGNLIEVPNYAYGIVIRRSNSCQVVFNQCYDASVTTQAAVWFEDAQYNLLIDGFIGALTGIKETGTAPGTNMRITANQSVASRFPQPVHGYAQLRAISPGTDSTEVRSIAGSGDQAGLWVTPSVNPYPEVGIVSVAAGRVTDGAITNGSTTVTSATAAWTANHVGLPIKGTGIPSGTRIQSVQSGTSATMSKAATATATGVTLDFVSFSTANNQEIGFTRRHIRTKGTIGAATAHANAGSGATAVVAGNDTAWKLTLTTGTGPAAGQQVSVAAGINWLNAAKLQLTARNAAAAGQAANVYLNNTISATTLHVVAPLAATTEYIWDVLAVE